VDVRRDREGIVSLVYKSKTGGTEFDANVSGASTLGELHEALGLPVAEFDEGSTIRRVPFRATAAETRAWARTIDRALRATGAIGRTGRGVSDRAEDIRQWVGFLVDSSGYRTEGY
jgi:hypothetical protein